VAETIFKQIRLVDDLELACLSTMESWWPVYAKQHELEAGIAVGSLAQPRSWLQANSLDREASDALPAIVVVSPGMSKPPQQEGDGSFRAFYNIAIGVFVAANTHRDTQRMVRMNAGIAKLIMLQKQSLGGFADGTTILDESFDDNFPFVDNQTISAGQVVFEVEIAGAFNRFGGPTTGAVTPVAVPDPATQPGSEWPLVETVNATVEVKED
jgi:hypothetical protein